MDNNFRTIHMSDNNDNEVLVAYEQYLAYFLDNDMDGINSLVKFPITYIHVHVLYTKNAKLTDAQTDAHIVRIDIRCVIHNLRVEIM